MAKFENTYMEFELEDGTKIQLTLAFYKIYQLKNKKKDIYEKYNKIMLKGPQEEVDMVTILYTAYLCANIDKIEECMTEIQFMQAIPQNRMAMREVIDALQGIKKK